MAAGISLPRLKHHLETLATFGRNPDGRGITRSCWSPTHEAARTWLLAQMKEAGLETRIDPAGNTFGILPGEGPAVLTGSHIDTVPEGGPLDGALGVLAGLECLQIVREQRLPVRRPLAVVAWSDEEGRYGSLFGSRSFCGRLDVTGLPTLTAQQDMMQVRWGSHGDYRIIALVPDSPQECFDLAIEAFNLSEIYRVPVFIMADETVGHMHEKVVIPPADEIRVVERNWYTGPKEDYRPYDFNGKTVAPMVKAGDGYRFHTTGLTHDERGYPALTPEMNKKVVTHLVEKIESNADKIIRTEDDGLHGADVVVVSYGISSRIAIRAIQQARKAGIKVGMLRLITVWPFCETKIRNIARKVKAIVVPELNYGQVVLEVERCAAGQCKVISVNSCGGAVHDPDEILAAIKEGVK